MPQRGDLARTLLPGHNDAPSPPEEEGIREKTTAAAGRARRRARGAHGRLGPGPQTRRARERILARETDGRDHHGQGRRDQDRVLPRGRAQDGGELRHAGQEGLQDEDGQDRRRAIAMAWSVLIKNGTVVDGSGAPGVAADVALEGDRIAAVGPALTGQAARTIDAKGLMVAPGFIDIHSHSDLVYQTCPGAESKVRQGVTTEVVGMCGFSPGPIGPGREDEVRDWIGGIGSKPRVTWHSFGEYLDSVRGLGVSVNVVQFVGHGALRWAAMGSDNRPATPDEQKKMEALLAEALEAGAWGYSTGVVYAPSVYGSTEELIALAKSMAKRGGQYFSHVRGEAATLEQAYEEAIRIGEEGGVPLQIAHVKASGRENWGKMERALRMISDARARGVDVTGDVYPYPAGSTKMDNLLP